MAQRITSTNKAQKAARSLARQNRAGLTWRQIAAFIALESGVDIPPGSLQRFAQSGIPPQNEDYQRALGLLRKRGPARRYTLPEQAARMPGLLQRIAKKIERMMNHA